MGTYKLVLVLCFAVALATGCSRQQSDWEKTRAANTTDSYEQFLKKYPSGEFTAQAQARAKDLYEEHDWQKARDTDTVEAYQTFLKQHAEGKWTEEARIRVENFTLAQVPSGAAGTTSTAPALTEPLESKPAPPVAIAAKRQPKAPAPDEKATKPPPKAGALATNPQPNAASAGFGVQLGAFTSGAQAANQRWAQLEKNYPSLLTGLHSKVAPKKTANGPIYRLQAMGLSEKKALAICSALKAKAQACVLLRP